MDDDAAAGPRILVVDDEHSIVDAVATSLRYEGFAVDTAMTGRAGLEIARSADLDLVVLDVMMPDLDGFEVARRMREEGIKTPILFLTAKADLEDKARGFGLGADDYVAKPFSLAEVVMRVQAILRRSGAAAAGSSAVLRFSDVTMDVDAHQVTRAGAPVPLTATEFRLLHLFLLNPGRVLSKAQILEHVWQYDFDGESNILETYMSYVRRKLSERGGPLLHTVRLVGYVLREDPPR